MLIAKCLNIVESRCRWLGNNTPGKRQSLSDIWTYVKRLKHGNLLSDKGSTQICVATIPEDEFGGTICNTSLKLYNRARGKGSSWITTRALEHMARYHKETKLAKDFDEIAYDAQESKVIHCLVDVYEL